MSWNYQTSSDRVKKHLDGMGAVNVEKLTREADLENLLSETECREVFGAHVYIDVPNFAHLATDIEGDDYKRIVQAVHLYQREVTRIVEKSFGGVRVHFQGPRLHALFYRPIGAADELATKAVALQLVVQNFVRRVFNSAFPRVRDLCIAGGADIGIAIGTQDGQRGDRELLFVGAPANYAAKIIRNVGELRFTPAIHESLVEQVAGLAEQDEGGIYTLGQVDEEVLELVLEALDIDWKVEDSADALEDEKRQFPLNGIDYGEADVAIDFDALSIRNNKRVQAASIFADVDGFTSYVDSAEDADAKKTALRVLHAIRKEMAAVVKQDFDGLRVQYQGDRVQGMFHLPKDDAEAIVAKAVKAAIALQSSMEYTLKAYLVEAGALHLAIGIDYGVTLASKLGIRADRDRICIGVPVERAARAQERCSGREIGVTPKCFALLPDELQPHFTKDERRGLYVGVGLTADKLERVAMAAAYGSGKVFVQSSPRGATVTSREGPGAREVLPSKSWAE